MGKYHFSGLLQYIHKKHCIVMGFFNTGYIAIQRLQPIYSPNPLYFSSKQDTRLL